MTRLAGKTAFIAGGGAGIGAASARLFARNGARVVVAEIDETLGRRVADAIAGEGGEAVFIRMDATEDASVRDAVAAAVAAFGRIDTLFNVIGGSRPGDSSPPKMDLDVYDRTVQLNLLGPILACRHAIPEIVKAGGGTVTNMSSGAGLRGASPKHAYTATKGAIISLTRALAGTYVKDNIRVNAICAGRILTERILNSVGRPGQPGPMADDQDATGRVKDYPFWVGEPEDIANIALFLASDESRMITGAAIAADGGRSAY